MTEVDNALSQIRKSLLSEFAILMNRMKATESKKMTDIILNDFKILADTMEMDFKNLNEQCQKMFAAQFGDVGDHVLQYHAKVNYPIALEYKITDH